MNTILLNLILIDNKLRNNSDLNQLITKHTTRYYLLQELTTAIEISDSAVGPDDIHYQMLKHLPQDALRTIHHKPTLVE